MLNNQGDGARSHRIPVPQTIARPTIRVGKRERAKEMASMTRKQWLLSGCVAFTTLISIAAVAGPIENYSPVTQARLENPGAGQLDAVSADL